MEQYQHSTEEMRAIADLVDAMNAFERTLNAHSVTVEGEIGVWWCDRVMGLIERLDQEDVSNWTYRPNRFV